MIHPLTSLIIVVLTLPNFLRLILNLIDLDLARRGKSAMKWAIPGGILMLLNPLSILLFPIIPSTLCIVGGSSLNNNYSKSPYLPEETMKNTKDALCVMKILRRKMNLKYLDKDKE